MYPQQERNFHLFLSMKKLVSIYKKEQFKPSLLGLFINPFYFVRLSIYKGIKRNAGYLAGELLDFGCGSKAYKDLFTVKKYIGLDVEQSGHPHTQESIDVFYDGRDIPFPDASFDSCFSSQVFEHVFDLEYSLKEINRILKPGGKCLFVVPFVWDEHEIPYDFARYSSFGLKYLLEKHNFAITKHEKDSHFFEVLIQLWCLYIYNLFHTKSNNLNLLFTLIFISPFNILGKLLSFIAPRNMGLYHNNIFLVEKKS